jgi:hypothetical protein
MQVGNVLFHLFEVDSGHAKLDLHQTESAETTRKRVTVMVDLVAMVVMVDTRLTRNTPVL